MNSHRAVNMGTDKENSRGYMGDISLDSNPDHMEVNRHFAPALQVCPRFCEGTFPSAQLDSCIYC